MKTIKSVASRMTQMCRPAWIVFLSSLQLCCLLLTASLLLYAGLFPDAPRSLAAALYELPEAILLIGVLISVCIEDAYRGRS